MMEDFNNDGKQPLRVPGFGLPIDHLPFETGWPQQAFRCEPCDYAFSERLTAREVAMLRCIDAITDKTDWPRKLYDEQIVNRWKEEVREISQALVDADVFEWVLRELRDKASDLATTGYVKAIDTASRVVKADNFVGKSLRQQLTDAARKLSDSVPKDWHPNSDNQVLNLVHPSLFPLVYGSSRVLTVGQTSLATPLASDSSTEISQGDQHVDPTRGRKYCIPEMKYKGLFSTRYQWLPCEVAFEGDAGANVRITSYVNNLHPARHQDLYGVLERMLSKAIPLWNAVLFRELDGRTAPRIRTKAAEFDTPEPDSSEFPHQWDDPGSDRNLELIKRVEKYYEQPDNPMWTDLEDEYFDEDDYDQWGIPENWRDTDYWGDEWPPSRLVEKRWRRIRQLQHPQPTCESWKEDLENVILEEEFRKRGLQVIIKLSSIELSPERPHFEGGGWHLEGMLNEHICATAIYYYDVANITTARIAFRQTAALDSMKMRYEQDDHEPLAQIFGCQSLTGEPAIQEIGSVATPEGRMIAFPNTLQHRVEPFELQDMTQPGHRRFLVLWLVDPYYRILSTANVPSQQSQWWQDPGKTPAVPGSDEVVQNLMTLEEAKEHRLELMKERTAFHERVEGDVETYNFCEH